MATIKKPAKKMQMGGATRSSAMMQKGGSTKKKTGMDALKAVGKYVSTFGGATERDDPKQKDINIVKKIKETAATAKKSLGLKKGGSIKKMGMGGSADSYTNYKMGGAVKAKNGKSFPDLNKDGKITKADILKGRGVIAKKGATLKKQAAVAIAMKKAGKAPKKMQYGGAAASMVPPMMKKGGATKKCKYGCK